MMRDRHRGLPECQIRAQYQAKLGRDTNEARDSAVSELAQYLSKTREALKMGVF